VPQMLGKLPVNKTANGLFGIAADVGAGGFLCERGQAKTCQDQRKG